MSYTFTPSFTSFESYREINSVTSIIVSIKMVIFHNYMLSVSGSARNLRTPLRGP